MNTEKVSLFQPFSFKNGITVKNRVAMAPMTTWASNDDYTVSDEELKHYSARVSGPGLVITGCTRVAPNGIGFTHEFASFNDSFLPSLKKLANAAKRVVHLPYCKSITQEIKPLPSSLRMVMW